MARRSGGRSGGGMLRTLERTGVNRGLLGGGGKGWLYVGTGLWTLRTIRRMAERKSEVLVSEELRPGERLVIANARPTLDAAGVEVRPGRRRRRRG